MPCCESVYVAAEPPTSLGQCEPLWRARLNIAHNLKALVVAVGKAREHRRIAVVKLPGLRNAEAALHAHDVLHL